MLVRVLVVMVFDPVKVVMTAMKGAFPKVPAPPYRESRNDSLALGSLAVRTGGLSFGCFGNRFPNFSATLALKFVKRHSYLQNTAGKKH
jgi:hypothetical protein